MPKKTKLDRKLRRAIARTYPAVAEALQELARSGLYGDGSLQEALIEVARERVLELMTAKHPLLSKTVAHLQARSGKQP